MGPIWQNVADTQITKWPKKLSRLPNAVSAHGIASARVPAPGVVSPTSKPSGPGGHSSNSKIAPRRSAEEGTGSLQAEVAENPARGAEDPEGIRLLRGAVPQVAWPTRASPARKQCSRRRTARP